MENLRGAGLMVLSMLLFAIEDMLIKLMAVDLPIGQIVGMLEWSDKYTNLMEGNHGSRLTYVLIIRANKLANFIL